MSPCEWFFVITAATSVPATMAAVALWLNGRYANKLRRELAAQTQVYLDRIDQRAKASGRDIKREDS